MDFAHLVTTPYVSGLLLTVGLLGLLLEMQTLHGFAGFIALAALAVFFGAHVILGVGTFGAVLAIIGLLLILYELHIVPGHAFPGILGGIALLFSMVLAFGPWSSPATLVLALQTVATAIVLTVLLFWIATRAFPENAWIAKLTFAGAQGPEYVTSSDYSALAGKSGVADSFLRPAGVASIEGHRVDVLTRGEFIAQGTPVRVTRVEGARIFVEPIALPSYKE